MHKPILAVLATAALMVLTPGASFADTSIGIYQVVDRDMDFQLAYCGADNKELCVTLLAVRGKANRPRTRAQVGKMIVDHAAPAGDNMWNGTVSLYGYTGSGTLTLHPGTEFLVHGCALVVICADQRLIPARQ